MGAVGELAIDFARCFLIGRVCLLRSVEITKVNGSPVALDLRAPATSVLLIKDATKPYLVSPAGWCVCVVLPPRRLTEIGEPVVKRVAVRVVEIAFRPPPMHVKPDEAMS